MLKHNKQKILPILAAVSVVTLSGCTWFSANDGREDLDEAYLESRQGAELQLPSDVTEIKQNDNYLIPEGAVIVNREPKGNLLGLEPPQLLLTSGDGIREDKDAKHPTVWIRGESNRLGEYIDGFVSSNNIGVINKSNQSLNTDWLSDDNDGIGAGLGSYNVDGQRHKFELAMIADSGNEFGIQAIHSASEQEVDGQWISVATSERVAKQFLNQFIGYYDGLRDREARNRVIAEGIIDTRLGTNPKGDIALVTDRDVRDIWQQTPEVLKSLNLKVTDRDESKGIFYFESVDASGIFYFLFGDGEAAKVDLEPGSYRMVFEILGAGGTSVTFETEQGEPLSANLVGKIYPDFKAAYRARQR